MFLINAIGYDSNMLTLECCSSIVTPAFNVFCSISWGWLVDHDVDSTLSYDSFPRHFQTRQLEVDTELEANAFNEGVGSSIRMTFIIPPFKELASQWASWPDLLRCEVRITDCVSTSRCPIHWVLLVLLYTDYMSSWDCLLVVDLRRNISSFLPLPSSFLQCSFSFPS